MARPLKTETGQTAQFSGSDPLTLSDLSPDPTAPAAGNHLIFPDDAGEWWTMDSAGTKRHASTPAGEWESYTPTWTSSGTNPSIGNGTIIGRYRILSKAMFITVRITMGSTTTYGTGGYFIDYPPGISPKQVADLDQILLAWYFDSSVGGFHYGMALVGGSGFAMRESSLVTATDPFIWGTGDRLVFSGSMEIA